jgi:hypothetical protein
MVKFGMLKYFLTFLCLLGASIFVTSKYENYAHNSTCNRPTSGTSIAPIPDTKDSTYCVEQTKRDHPSWYLAYEIVGWPTGITVWALFLSLIVIADQTRHSARAAEATEKSVKSNQEGSRAWIGVRVYSSGEERLPSGMTPKISWEIKNSGQTPAFLTEISLKIAEVNSAMGHPDFEWEPRSIYTFIGAGHTETNGLFMTYDTYRKCQIGVKHFKVYGRIKYKDTFGHTHETGFSFHYHPNAGDHGALRPGFHQDIDPKYNYNT